MSLESILSQKVKDYFGHDQRRIVHAHKVLHFAKDLALKEGGDIDIIIAAALLHDIGIKECERKYSSTDGQLQEKEGPPIATNILHDLGMSAENITEICAIIASHHSPGEVDTLNFKIIWDADWLVNLRDEYGVDDKGVLGAIIAKVFLTESGKQKAREIYGIDKEK